MRHQKNLRKLGRTHQHRLAMLRNLSLSLIFHEKVRTTEAKAREAQKLVEGWIRLAQSQDLSSKRKLLAELHQNKLAVRKLREVLANRYEKRNGGYTSLYRLESRPGDNAPMCLLSLV